LNFLKTTVIGGLVFLVPVAVLILVLAKVFGVMVAIAEPMADKIPMNSIGGIAIANVIAVMIILLICFAAGLVARTRPAQKFANSIENAVLQKIPGYSLIRGMTSSLTPDKTAHMHAVLVSLGYTSRIGLEADRTEDGNVTVYFPGSPNAWSGELHIVKSDQITPVERPMMAVIEHAEQLGSTTSEFLSGRRSS
jgi:uncharacterized membrane protein